MSAVGEKRIGRRGDQKRRWDRDNRERCRCGEPMWQADRCRECFERERDDATFARRQTIAGLFNDGASLKAIAEFMDSTVASIGVELVRMRRDGWNVPPRGPGGRAR
jgi:hypothetical protein